MTVSASTQIPKTSDPAVFQRQCKVLFEHVLNDPHIEEFGTSGQGQSGIDLLGRRRARGLIIGSASMEADDQISKAQGRREGGG